MLEELAFSHLLPKITCNYYPSSDILVFLEGASAMWAQMAKRDAHNFSVLHLCSGQTH